MEHGDIDLEMFRQALSRYASGVTIVTSRLGDEIGGMTVSAFCSVALEPHLILVSLTIDKETTKLVAESGRFVVNVLAEGQADLSDRFAFVDHPERFEGVGWSPGVAGIPIIDGCLAVLECRVAGSFPAGDHLLFIGETQRVTTAEGTPLIYSQGAYRPLGDLAL